MEKRTIPNTNLQVSSLCLGSMNWGRQNSEAEAHEQLDYATSRGINFIDTAEIYPIPPDRATQGKTEEFVGSWLRKRGKRNDLVIASKVASRNQANFMATRQASGGLTKQNINEAVHGSLTRLGVDYLDLYQVHVPDRKANYFGVRGVVGINTADDGVPIEETLETLSDLVKQGKVRAVGVSNETPWGLSEYLRLSREKGLARVSTIQNQYSLINRTFEIGLSEICLREHVGLLIYSPLSKGVLTGKYLGGARPEGSRFALFERDIDRYNPERAQPVIKMYKDIAEKHGMTLTTMSIAYAMSRSFTTSVILGATKVEQLQELLGAGDLVLSPEVLAEIEAVYTEHPDPTA